MRSSVAVRIGLLVVGVFALCNIAASGCGSRGTTTTPTTPPATSSLSKHITEDGPYVINDDILPGVWTALVPNSSPSTIKCHWELKQTLSNESGIKDGGGDPGDLLTVDITTGFYSFTTDHCGGWTWTKSD